MRSIAWPAVALVMSAAALSGCGRSAPEGASAAAEGGEEPAVAGIQVISEEPVVAPAPSTTVVATTVTTVATSAVTYVVEPGDTLSVIARRFAVTVDALSQANDIADVNSIKPGQELIIPAG